MLYRKSLEIDRARRWRCILTPPDIAAQAPCPSLRRRGAAGAGGGNIAAAKTSPRRTTMISIKTCTMPAALTAPAGPSAATPRGITQGRLRALLRHP
jgi:hypothetical protein